jgi:hypothetical protein
MSQVAGVPTERGDRGVSHLGAEVHAAGQRGLLVLARKQDDAVVVVKGVQRKIRE